VSFPAYCRIEWQGAPPNATIKNTYKHSDDHGQHISIENAKKEKERGQAIYQATCTNVVVWPCKSPHPKTNQKPKPKENRERLFWIKEKKRGA